MRRRFITNVTPLENYVLQVEFVSGSHVMLDMKPYLESVRFCPLKDRKVWRSATTNGLFVRFCDVELAHDEILTMLEVPQNNKDMY